MQEIYCNFYWLNGKNKNLGLNNRVEIIQTIDILLIYVFKKLFG